MVPIFWATLYNNQSALHYSVPTHHYINISTLQRDTTVFVTTRVTLRRVITEKVNDSVVVAGKQSNHVLEHCQEAVTDDSIGQFIW